MNCKRDGRREKGEGEAERERRLLLVIGAANTRDGRQETLTSTPTKPPTERRIFLAKAMR